MLLIADIGEQVGDVEFDDEEAVDDGANLGIKFNCDNADRLNKLFCCCCCCCCVEKAAERADKSYGCHVFGKGLVDCFVISFLFVLVSNVFGLELIVLDGLDFFCCCCCTAASKLAANCCGFWLKLGDCSHVFLCLFNAI